QGTMTLRSSGAGAAIAMLLSPAPAHRQRAMSVRERASLLRANAAKAGVDRQRPERRRAPVRDPEVALEEASELPRRPVMEVVDVGSPVDARSVDGADRRRSEESLQADYQGIVRHRDDRDAVGSKEPRDRGENRLGIDRVLEHLGADDAVVARVRDGELV